MASAGGSRDLGIDGLVSLGEIGQGGFGSVYRARDEAHGRDVAVKLLHASTDERSRQRFNRERKLMGSVSGHPNILTIYTSGFSDQGVPFLSMELIEGGSLAERIGQGVLTPRQARDIGVALGEALCVAHETGVLHLDIKPENVLMGARGEPLLADFGIASTMSEISLRQTISISPSFSPPEILNNDNVDVRADVYSLAATLYTCLTGRLPYEGEPSGLMATLTRVANDPIPRASAPNVPSALADVLVAGMAKQSVDRPATMRDFTDRLKAIDLDETRIVLPTVPAGSRATVETDRPSPRVESEQDRGSAGNNKPGGSRPTGGGAEGPETLIRPAAQPPAVASAARPPQLPSQAPASHGAAPTESGRTRTGLYAAAALLAVLVIAGVIFVATRGGSDPVAAPTQVTAVPEPTTEPAVRGRPTPVADEPAPSATSVPTATEVPEPTATTAPTAAPAVAPDARPEFTPELVRLFSWATEIDDETKVALDSIDIATDRMTQVCASWIYATTSDDTAYEIRFLIDGAPRPAHDLSGITESSGTRWAGCYRPQDVCTDCGLDVGVVELVFIFDGREVFNESILVSDTALPIVEITVQNNHPVPLCRFEATPLDARNLGLNHLTRIVPPNGSFTFSLVGGVYRTVSTDCQGNVVSRSSPAGHDLSVDSVVTES